MKVNIYGLNHQGMGIGKINGKVIFVEHALVGEIVEVDIVKEYNNYFVGKVNKVIKKSDDRCNYNCKYYDKCGGCNIGILKYEKQLEFKKNKVIDIFRKYGNLNINPDIVGSCEFGYRNKVMLHVENGKLGYYESESNSIVEIDRCLIANDKINEIIDIIKNNINLNKVNKIVIRATHEDSMVVFEGKINIKDIDYLKNISSIYINDKLVYGKDKIIEKLGNYNFYISKDSFFQVNTKQAFNLYNQVLEYANLNKNDYVVDLYCGTGTIGIFLAKHCKRVLGIEINESCIKDARNNSKLNNIDNIDFMCESSSIISKLDDKFDVVIVDPPRSGLDKITVNTLNKIMVKRIVYVSCNPMTLIRDIKLLSGEYELKEVKLFDMFAGDYHVETICVLERE